MDYRTRSERYIASVEDIEATIPKPQSQRTKGIRYYKTGFPRRIFTGTISNLGYFDSQDDSAGNHPTIQWQRAVSFTGSSHSTSNPTGAVICGAASRAVSGFFPNGLEVVYTALIELDTTTLPRRPFSFSMTINLSSLNKTVPWTMYFAPYDFGSTITFEDWLSPGQVPIAVGSITSATMTGLGAKTITLNPSAITPNGYTRLIAYSDAFLRNTPPADEQLLSVIYTNVITWSALA